MDGGARFDRRGSVPKSRGPRVGRGIGQRRAGGGVGNPGETFTHKMHLKTRPNVRCSMGND